MPLVRFLVDVGGAWAAFSEVELSAEEAAKWCDGYRAEYVREERTERATAKPRGEKARKI